MRARAALLDEIERQPARFLLRELMRLEASTGATPAGRLRLRDAATEVAGFLGCDGDGLVFVDNATAGVCAVLRSIPLAPGDEVLVAEHAYGGVARAATFIAAERGASVATYPTPFPVDDAARIVDALAAAITPRTRLVIADHVVSETALVMPLAAMVDACRDRGVAVLVDGAHAPGAIELDIGSLGVDWYAANLHKWAFAPRSCGVLWAAPHRRVGLHPPVISWGVTGDDWLAEFDWTGTRDPTPWLAAPAGIAFARDTLGLDAMRAHNHRLAWDGATGLARRWNRSWTTPESMIGCMATSRCPRRSARRMRRVRSDCATPCCSIIASSCRCSRSTVRSTRACPRRSTTTTTTSTASRGPSSRCERRGRARRSSVTSDERAN